MHHLHRPGYSHTSTHRESIRRDSTPFVILPVLPPTELNKTRRSDERRSRLTADPGSLFL